MESSSNAPTPNKKQYIDDIASGFGVV